MAFDTITVKALVSELREKLLDGKIEKIYQPENDLIIITVKTFYEAFRLLISANSSHPRIHLTSVQKENPQKAPLFCMLLRKHLQGGKINEISQIENERIVKIGVDTYDELGDKTIKYLYCEITGRNSNIILTKNDGIIIDSIKRINFSLSSVRQILPGLMYELPPKQEKLPILSDLSSLTLDFNKSGKTAENVISECITGIAPLLIREAVYKAVGENNIDSTLVKNGDAVIKELNSFKNRLIKPCILTEIQSGKSIDFSPFDIFQYADNVSKDFYDSISTMLDDYYKNRDLKERMRQKSTDLVHLLNTLIERVAKKLTILKKTLKDAEKKDEYKQKGDLLSAYIYLLKEGMSEITLENYFDENKNVRISLNPMLNPSQNVQRYYKLYRKAKNAEIEAAKQLDNAQADLEYLESTLVLVQNSSTESDLNAIRYELSEYGYTKNKFKGKNNKKANTSKPMHYISSDGFDIYVGKNNMQNDMLTLKFANSSDMWFHTKKIHGSHTVIKLGINKDIPERTIKEAAGLAAYYSKARSSQNVPVDYTQIKNVKKPNGAKYGMVIYDHYNTIYVNPKEDGLEKIT